MKRRLGWFCTFALALLVASMPVVAHAEERDAANASNPTTWQLMPTAKKITVMGLVGLGLASSVAWVYWGIDGEHEQTLADNYRLSHGNAAEICGAGNAGCGDYAGHHLAAEKAGTYQKGYMVGWLALDAAALVTLFVWPNQHAEVKAGAGSLLVEGKF